MIVKFCRDLGKTPTQTLKMFEQMKREHLESRALVFKWHRRFADGHDSLEEQGGHAGRKETVWRNNSDVREALAADKRLAIRELIKRFD